MKYYPILKMFYEGLKGKETFTSDDFRDLKLEEYMAGSAQGSVGAVFTNAEKLGYIEKTGELVKSRLYRRRIFEYRWTDKAIKEFEAQTSFTGPGLEGWAEL